MIDLLSSRNGQVQMKILSKDTGACKWLYLHTITTWIARSLDGNKTPLKILEAATCREIGARLYLRVSRSRGGRELTITKGYDWNKMQLMSCLNK